MSGDLFEVFASVAASAASGYFLSRLIRPKGEATTIQELSRKHFSWAVFVVSTALLPAWFMDQKLESFMKYTVGLVIVAPFAVCTGSLHRWLKRTKQPKATRSTFGYAAQIEREEVRASHQKFTSFKDASLFTKRLAIISAAILPTAALIDLIYEQPSTVDFVNARGAVVFVILPAAIWLLVRVADWTIRGWGVRE